MESTLNYLSIMYPTISQDYRTREGGVACCGMITVDIARRLIAEGSTPTILIIHGERKEQFGLTSLLIPKQFGGRITWRFHLACLLDGQIYDPMISAEPVPSGTCYREAFRDETKVTVLVEREKTRDVVKIRNDICSMPEIVEIITGVKRLKV